MDIYCREKCVDLMIYREIFDALDTAVLLFDAEGYLQHANNMARILLPKTHTYKDFILYAYDHSLEVDEQLSLGEQHQKKDDRILFHEVLKINDRVYAANSRLMKGDFMGQSIVEVNDITPLKQRCDAMIALSKDKQILVQAIQSSSKGIFVAENKGEFKLIFSNEGMDKLFGFPIAEFIDKNISEFLEPLFQDEWGDILKAIQKGEGGKFSIKILSDDNKPTWLQLNLTVSFDENLGNILIGFISDETQHMIRDNQLLQAQKLDALGQLAGGVAHDFNNILSIIDGFIRLTDLAVKRGENVENNIQRIRKAVERGSGLTKQLLMFGKKKISDDNIVDICAQMKDIELLLRPVIGENISLMMECPTQPITLRGTGDNFTQIVMNLAINARDAIVEKGNISMKIAEHKDSQGHYVVLEVIDDGTGIPDSILSKIYDPFFSTKEQGKGTGLGLSMVYGLVQQMGGEISVHSQESVGTCFTLIFPIVELDVTETVSIESNGSAEILKGKTILVAEDEADLLDIIDINLSEMGLRVLKASNGQEALVIQDEYNGKIDFLLTDMVMPELGGQKLAALMREVRPDTHIVFMSGYPIRNNAAQIDLPEDSVFLAKPVKPEHLQYTLEDCLNSGQAQKQVASHWEN